MRATWILAVVAAAGSVSPPARAHELWFQPARATDPAVVRLTFGDTPAAADAERVAEIARTKVWVDAKPLEVKRLPDGLEVNLQATGGAIVSAFADRGVIDYMGDTFVIYLAAYAQRRPLAAAVVPSLGLDDDQLRLLLVSSENGPPVVRALWKGKPTADLTVQVFRRPGESPATIELNGRGEMPCPSLKAGPVSLLAVVMDKTPGRRDGRDYSHIRYKATLTIEPEAQAEKSISECLARVEEIHGAAGPWAVAGYRIGERALKELGLPRHSFELDVVHRAPGEVQYSCIADGVQAATGASPGKLNLRVEEAAAEQLSTVIRDRKTGRSLTFTLHPTLIRSIKDLPHERFETEARRIASIADDAIFVVTPGK